MAALSLAFGQVCASAGRFRFLPRFTLGAPSSIERKAGPFIRLASYRRLARDSLPPSEVDVIPTVVRLGRATTPHMDHVRHRFMANVTSRDVDVFEENGVLVVSGDVFVTQRASEDGSQHYAGVYTSEAWIPPFAFTSALRSPLKTCLWTLSATSTVPPQLVVRRDPFNLSHVLWAPRHRMKLATYRAALASVGRDETGAYSGWTRWQDPQQLLDTLPMDAEKREQLPAAVAQQTRTLQRKPGTAPQFTARALLSFCVASAGVDDSPFEFGFLSDMAEAAAVVADGGEHWLAFVASCRQVLGLPSPDTTLAIGNTGMSNSGNGGRSMRPGTRSVSTWPMLRVLVHIHGGSPPMHRSEVDFVRAALLAARDELVEHSATLDDLDGEALDAELDSLEVQFRLGAAAAAALGMPDVLF